MLFARNLFRCYMIGCIHIFCGCLFICCLRFEMVYSRQKKNRNKNEVLQPDKRKSVKRKKDTKERLTLWVSGGRCRSAFTERKTTVIKPEFPKMS